MRLKIYNGITGVLKILCAIYIGLFLGGLAFYDSVQYFPFLEAWNVDEIFRLLLLLFATLGYIMIITSGFIQIKSLFKPIQLKVADTVFINILSLPFIIAVWRTYIIYSSIFDSDDVLVITLVIYVLSVFLIILDVIFALVRIKKENIQIFTEANFMIVLRTISILIVPSLIVLLGIILGLTIKNNLNTIKMNEAIDTGFESFEISDFDGNAYTEDILKGHKVIMMNVWGTFCPNCIDEMPELEEISKMYDENDFLLIGLTGDLYRGGELDQGQVDLAIDIVEKTGVTYPIVIPSKNLQVGVINNIRLYPTTVFLDEDGNQLKIIIGGRSKEEWIEEIEEVLSGEEGNK